MSAAQKTHMLQSGSVSDRQAMEAPRSHPVANTAPEDSNGFPWHLVRKCFTDSRRPMSHSCQFLPWAGKSQGSNGGRGEGGGLQKDPSTNVTVVTRAITPWRFRGREVDPDHVLTNRHCHSELRSPSTNQHHKLARQKPGRTAQTRPADNCNDMHTNIHTKYKIQTDRRTDRQTDRQPDRETQTDRQTDRQTDIVSFSIGSDL